MKFAGLSSLFSAIAVGFGSATEEPQPPRWADQWSAEFTERIELVNGTESKVRNQNHGRWFYDWPNRQSRFDHDSGHMNNFCRRGANGRVSDALKPDNDTQSCRLYFDASEKMFVSYPDSGFCCELCAGGLGCTILLPSWVSTGVYEGKTEAEGRTCDVWHAKGAVAEDYWMEDSKGVPCRYQETFGNPVKLRHTIQFHKNSYVRGPEAVSRSDIFTVPDGCEAKCLKPWPPVGPPPSRGALRGSDVMIVRGEEERLVVQ
uniref:Uncharacterized protein n=1 Tax=Chromera velia CCMP2878 TaxID=1169474 RepID=A0A0G4H892_9ALVE|mmetsp:Transcript_26157/g.51353  ORF Transcript_26157/g.51353 Transcript_26157/m.51353 type:complete len:260 (-) Transcript_26157:101-880(-)|eukprot:Cvel_25089.t1-p1 / transcript=Cvel_25089.t1 / gene=Cvel_25089 / organism=Chromera_velia_CCMP2878 / gene_product=hypothetical protein / transcript_product=hypothetical protein / location=Cvel_scaffold2796:20398-22196(-) / protein_length=259 / sequence_SO=supercontig / SO=protein_coding / is_pseudo=false